MFKIFGCRINAHVHLGVHFQVDGTWTEKTCKRLNILRLLDMYLHVYFFLNISLFKDINDQNI